MKNLLSIEALTRTDIETILAGSGLREKVCSGMRCNRQPRKGQELGGDFL